MLGTLLNLICGEVPLMVEQSPKLHTHPCPLLFVRLISSLHRKHKERQRLNEYFSFLFKIKILICKFLGKNKIYIFTTCRRKYKEKQLIMNVFNKKNQLTKQRYNFKCCHYLRKRPKSKVKGQDRFRFQGASAVSGFKTKAKPNANANANAIFHTSLFTLHSSLFTMPSCWQRR